MEKTTILTGGITLLLAVILFGALATYVATLSTSNEMYSSNSNTTNFTSTSLTKTLNSGEGITSSTITTNINSSLSFDGVNDYVNLTNNDYTSIFYSVINSSLHLDRYIVTKNNISYKNSNKQIINFNGFYNDSNNIYFGKTNASDFVGYNLSEINEFKGDYIFDDFSTYSNNYNIIEDFENISEWVGTATITQGDRIAYGNSSKIVFQNTQQVNKTLANINTSMFDILKIWVNANFTDSDGYDLKLYDNTGKLVKWHINSNTNSLRRNLLQLHNSTYGEQYYGISSGFNWENITLIMISEATLDKPGSQILIDDIRLSNSEGDAFPNWTDATEVDGRHGDWSIINDSGVFKMCGITYMNASLLSQTAILYKSLNYSSERIIFYSEDYGNSSDNIHTLWFWYNSHWDGHHDTTEGNLLLFRNNLSLSGPLTSMADNTISLKQRYSNGSIGSPNDAFVITRELNYSSKRVVDIFSNQDYHELYVNGNFVYKVDSNLSNPSTNGTDIYFRLPSYNIMGCFTNITIITNLSGYYKLNEANGTTAYDSSGNGNNGVISGATWQTSGTKTLTSGVDYTLDLSTGLLTLSSEYLYSWINTSWNYNTTYGFHISIMRIIAGLIALAVLAGAIAFLIKLYREEN